MWGISCEDSGLLNSLRNPGSGGWVTQLTGWGGPGGLSLAGLSLDDCLLLVFSEIPRVWASAFEASSFLFSAVSVGGSFLEPVIQPQEGIQFLSSPPPSDHVLGLWSPRKPPATKHKIPWMGASLVAQWLRIRLPMQGTWVRALVREDPTCCGAAKPVCHNYRACALEPASRNC